MKDNTYISRKLTNRAWKDMEARLDKEMPAERKKKPLFWWLFGFVVLGLLSFGFLNKNADTKYRDVPVEPFIQQNIQEPIAQKAKAVQPTLKNSDAAEIKKEVELGQQPIQKPITTDNYQIELTNNSDNKTEKSKERVAQYHSQVSIQNDGYEFNAQQIEETALAKVATLNNEFKEPAKPLDTEFKEAAIIENKEMSILPSRRNFAFEQSEIRLNTIHKLPRYSAPNYSKFTFGFAATYGAINIRGNTWSMGVESDLYLNSRFALGANFAFRQRQYREKDAQFLYVQEDDLERAVAQSSMPQALANYDLHYVSPELIAFQVNHIESIEFGLHPAVRVWKNAWLEGRLSTIRARKVGTYEQKFDASLKSDEVSSAVKNAFSDWDIMYGVGLRYQFNQHIGVGMRVQTVFQTKKLQGSDIQDNTSLNAVPRALPVISQPLFAEMGISCRLW